MPRLKVTVVTWGPLVGPVVDLVRPWPRWCAWAILGWNVLTLENPGHSTSLPGPFRQLFEIIVFLMSFLLQQSQNQQSSFSLKKTFFIAISNSSPPPIWPSCHTGHRIMHETVAEATGLHDQAGNGTSHGHRIHFRNHWWNEATGEQEASQSLEICLGSNLTNTTL